MRRTMIHAIAAGAAASCLALATPATRASDGELGALPTDDEPAPLVEQQPAPAFAAAPGDAPAEFVWSSDLPLTPPPYLTRDANAHLAPPSASATAIPLPPGAWTGLASLAGLGTIALVRRLRRAR